MKYLFFIITSLLLIGCAEQSNENKVFFGGEIINPKSEYVLLLEHDKVIDSIPLQRDNSFGKYIAGIQEGLYSFKHGQEFQYLYLEPNDSISIRLNTWDFDETLVFDGDGADKNELLLDLFLVNEQERENFHSYFEFTEAAFQKKIDEVFLRHTRLMNQLIASNSELSENFKHLAKGVVKFPIYRLKEIYPFYHKTNSSKKPFQLSANYYAYRDQINLNDAILSDHFSYQNFINAHLYNIAFHENGTGKFDDSFKGVLLNEITKKIHLSDLKNRLLFQEVNNLLFSNPVEIKKEYLSLFYNNSSDSSAVETVKEVILAKEALKNNHRIKSFNLITRQQDTLALKELIKDKQSVVYFLPPTFKFNSFLNKRLSYLSRKYPKYNFIGVHLNREDFEEIPSKLNNQYLIENNEDVDFLFSDKYLRSILIDEHGIVVNNFALINSMNLERQFQVCFKKS